VRSDQSVIEASLREHAAKVESQRREAEEEISRLKAQLVSERIKQEEELSHVRQKLKADQVHNFSSSHILTAMLTVYSPPLHLERLLAFPLLMKMLSVYSPPLH